MRDIETRDDIDALMRAFYEKILQDPAIGYLFTEVAKIDLDHHLPIIGDFWETVLLGTGNYMRHGRNPLQVHLALNAKEHLRPEHFRRWLELFGESVDGLFSGKRALFAKQRAQGIASRFMSQMPDAPEATGLPNPADS
jgi:hemoglobin